MRTLVHLIFLIVAHMWVVIHSKAVPTRKSLLCQFELNFLVCFSFY